MMEPTTPLPPQGQNMAAAMPRPRYKPQTLQGPWNPLWGNTPQLQSPFAPSSFGPLDPNSGMTQRHLQRAQASAPETAPLPATPVPNASVATTDAINAVPAGSPAALGGGPAAPPPTIPITPPTMTHPPEMQQMQQQTMGAPNIAPPPPVDLSQMPQMQPPVTSAPTDLMGNVGSKLGSALTGFF